MRFRRCAVLFSVVVFTAFARPCVASSDLARGVVVDRVLCSDGSHSYALYLPTAYSSAKKWPILFCFDPAARGPLPVGRFKAAAERYGWIVVGSNDSRNGPVQPAVESLQAMWRDVHERFAVDDARVYFTGFSGGSRIASRAALLCNCAAGVIGTGAGFPEGIAPARESAPAPAAGSPAALGVRFAYFGVVGTDDFNYGEMRELAHRLDALGLPNRLAVFDGPHVWPPEGFCTEAVAWMEVRAMKEGRRARDESLVAERYAAALDAARASERAGNVAEAFGRYAAAAADFAGLADVAAAEAGAKRYERSDEVKRALKDEERQIQKQHRDTVEAIQLWTARETADDGAFATKSRFRAAIRALDEAGQRADDTPERRVARRTLYSVFAYFIETGMGLREQGKLREAVDTFRAACEAAPRNPWPFYELARTQARGGNVKAAVEALTKSAELGFANAKDLAENPDWARLRSDPAFKVLVEKVK